MNARPVHPGSAARGFTLVELLVTITIIGILTSVVLGALNAARQTARVAKTKSMIARLDHIIMQRYESYHTRRVPIKTAGMAPKAAAVARLDAIRDLMRMEMPERFTDISNGPVAGIDRPALSVVYMNIFQPPGAPDPLPSPEYGPAECLYLIVNSGSTEDREKFSDREIGDLDNDGFFEFLDGWGKPIMFLRLAPGFVGSDIQTGNALESHDPFDTRNLEEDAYRLIPLIYSAGPDEQYDIDLNGTYEYQGDPYASGAGTPVDEDADGLNHHDNIHNHHIEQR